MSEWQPINTAPEETLIDTKIDDSNGMRNVAWLRKRGRLWFLEDDSMYVYYTPTHWRPLQWPRDALKASAAFGDSEKERR